MRTDSQAPDSEALMRPAEVRAVLRIDTKTLMRMADRGDIAVVKLPSGHRRYPRAAVLAMAEGR